MQKKIQKSQNLRDFVDISNYAETCQLYGSCHISVIVNYVGA